MVKNPPANAGDIREEGSIPGSGRSPGGGHDNPLQYSCLENSMDRGSLAGYSPRGCKESEATKRLSTHAHTHTHITPGCKDFFEAPYVSLNVSQGENHWGNG